MKGDFSRDTFAPQRQKKYKAVLMQQGRVQLDADWNQNVNSLFQRIETETKDVIGLCGFPADHAGFGVMKLDNGDFKLTAGRAYVDGILCEIDQDVSFSQQPYIKPFPEPGINEDGMFLAYLDVWERLITALEDDEIREVALGGPDTGARRQVVWQVRLKRAGEVDANLDCDDAIEGWPPAASDGTLCARTHPQEQPQDPCVVAPGAGYRRLENQLYRVEILNGSDADGGPTFLWDRNNAFVAVAIDELHVDGSSDTLRVANLGPDGVLGFREMDPVQVTDDSYELSGRPGPLNQILKIDREQLIITLKNPVAGVDMNLSPKLRRWDSAGALKVETPAVNDGYIPLEDGIEVRFGDGSFHTGDYWCITARTIPGQYGDIEWPQGETGPACLLPFGIQHHYCRLALLRVENGQITDVTDCRQIFSPLTGAEQTPGTVRTADCCSVTVGEGGDFADIQDAVNARPADAESWSICVLPGVHRLERPIIVRNQKGFTLSGCGDQTFILSSPRQRQPILALRDVTNVRLEGLSFSGPAQFTTLLLLSCSDVSILNCRVENLLSQQLRVAALTIVACERVKISNSQFRGQPALVAHGQFFDIVGNQFTGGGIQCLPGSEALKIEANRIQQGFGPGIQLGGTLDFTEITKFFESIPGAAPEGFRNRSSSALQVTREILFVSIINNFIAAMSGSGILTLERVFDQEQQGEVVYLDIVHNEIIECAQIPDLWLTNDRAVGGGINLSSVFAAQICDNLVAHNGLCGIVVSYSSNVDLACNKVIANGLNTQPGDQNYLAGIAGLFISGNGQVLLDRLAPIRQRNLLDASALRVYDNEVVATGLAFVALVAGDATQITGNSFMSQGERVQNPLSQVFPELAACIQVLNLGNQRVLPGPAGGQMGGLHVETAPGARMANSATNTQDGRVMFNDNQVTLVSPELPGAQIASAIFSGDDISLQGNQFQLEVHPGKMLADVFAVGTTLRAIGNNFSELQSSVKLSYFASGKLMNIASLNTAVHCILVVPQSIQRVEVNNLVLLPDQSCDRLTQIF
jgi:hypothetical protein